MKVHISMKDAANAVLIGDSLLSVPILGRKKKERETY